MYDGGQAAFNASGLASAAVAAVSSSAECLNATALDQYIRVLVRNATLMTRARRREIEGDPLVYIIAVLVFYSCGIVVLMINYMKKEQNEVEEANMYTQYVGKARDRYNEFNRTGRTSLNRLALQALNAVSVISQDDQSRVAFV